MQSNSSVSNAPALYCSLPLWYLLPPNARLSTWHSHSNLCPPGAPLVSLHFPPLLFFPIHTERSSFTPFLLQVFVPWYLHAWSLDPKDKSCFSNTDTHQCEPSLPYTLYLNALEQISSSSHLKKLLH